MAAGGGFAKKPFPTEYVFTRHGYDVYYDYVGGGSPVFIDRSESVSVTAVTSQCKLARLSDGTLFAVYFKQLNGFYQVYVKKSTDNGETWTDETRISTAGVGHHSMPSIAVDSDDCLHVVWSGNYLVYPANSQIWYAYYDGSWSTPIRISTGEGMDQNVQLAPCIAVDGEGCLHVVWSGSSPDFDYYDYQVWYTKFDGSWSEPVRLSTYPSMNLAPHYDTCIAIDSNNYLHVVWWDAGTTVHIWYVKYDGSWSEPIWLSTLEGMGGTRGQNHPCIAVDPNDYLHVVWSGRSTSYPTNYQIWYRRFVTSWGNIIRLSTFLGMNEYQQRNPSISIDDKHYLHVVWQGMATGYEPDWKVWYSYYDGNWATPECLQPTGANYQPNVRWSR